MRWPSLWKSAPPEREPDETEPPPNPPHKTDTLSAKRYLLAPENLPAVLVLTTSCLALYGFWRSYLRRIPEAGNISPGFFRKRSLFGRVTSVGDGDNFRVFHTPGGRLAGWGWAPGRKVPEGKKELKDKTVWIFCCAGLAGSKVDAWTAC